MGMCKMLIIKHLTIFAPNPRNVMKYLHFWDFFSLYLYNKKSDSQFMITENLR